MLFNWIFPPDVRKPGGSGVHSCGSFSPGKRRELSGSSSGAVSRESMQKVDQVLVIALAL
jgi:hypothetical protein